MISDTHVPDRQKEIPREILKGLAGVDMIIHAGDLTCLEVIEKLKEIAPVHAVHGNMDPQPVRSKLRPVRTIRVGSKSIAVMHGGGSPESTTEKARTQFPEADCVVFGHTHSPYNEYQGKSLIFNPGSACKCLWSIASYGILYVDEKDEKNLIKGEIFRV